MAVKHANKSMVEFHLTEATEETTARNLSSTTRRAPTPVACRAKSAARRLPSRTPSGPRKCGRPCYAIPSQRSPCFNKPKHSNDECESPMLSTATVTIRMQNPLRVRPPCRLSMPCTLVLSAGPIHCSAKATKHLPLLCKGTHQTFKPS